MSSKIRHKVYAWIAGIALSLGFLLRILAGPLVSDLPEDFSYQADVISVDNFYDEDLGVYGEEIESKSRFFYETQSSEDGVLLLNHVFDVKGLNGAPVFNVARTYAIDKESRKHIPTLGDRSREGSLFAPQMGNRILNSFDYWHVSYDTKATMKHQGVVIVDGLELHRYRANISADQTKNLNYLPGVPLDRGIITEATIDLWIEPVSGYLVNYSDTATAWYYDQDTKEKIAPWNEFSNTYSDLSFAYHVSKAQQQKTLILLLKTVGPSSLMIFGLIFLVFGVIAYVNKRRFQGADDEEDRINPGAERTFFVPLTIFIILIVITLWLWSEVRQNIKKDNRELFDQEIGLIESAITSRADLYIGALQSGVSLFDASNEVSRDEWRMFAAGLNLQKNFPGIQGYGYSEYVAKEDKEAHVEKIRSEGFPEFDIKPEGEREEYTSIIYLEPFDERNIQAFGLDMTFESNRRNAMHAARDTGKPKMSGRVILVQEIDDDIQPGFLMYIPQYSKNLSVDTVDQKREALEGYVYSPFRMRDFMTGILGDRELVLDFVIHDDSQNASKEDTFMYSSERLGDGEPRNNLEYLTDTKTLSIADRDWIITYTPRPEFVLGHARQSSSNILLISGILLSFLIALVFYLISASRLRAVRIARHMTKELENKVDEIQKARDQAEIEEEKTKAILSSIGDGLIVVDAHGVIVLTNNAFEELTGWTQFEAFGNRLGELLPLVDDDGKEISKKERPITKALSSGKAMSNQSEKHDYITKKQEALPVAISVSPIVVDGELVGAVEVFRDITKEYEIDKAKTEFVSLASHQLRTPLTAISWYSEMLSDNHDQTLTEDQKTYAKEINIGSTHMIELVNALLNVSRIELGTFTVDPKNIDLAKILSEVVGATQIIARDKEIAINVEDSKAPKEYRGDPSLMRIIFQNLITNSLKYTEKGEVDISMYPVGDSLRIEVSDTGYGIPEDQKKQIFKKMFRADNVKAQDTTGTGLGLYIIKAIVDEVGGKIWFESEEGEGTTFFINLPLSGMKAKQGSKFLEM